MLSGFVDEAGESLAECGLVDRVVGAGSIGDNWTLTRLE